MFRPRTETVTALQVEEALQAMSAVLRDPPKQLIGWSQRFDEMQTRAEWSRVFDARRWTMNSSVNVKLL